MIVDFISNQNVLLFLHRWVTFVFHLLEPRFATMMTMEALSSHHLFLTAAAVGVTLKLLAPLTRPLDLDFGSQCTHHFALQKAVAAKVSGDES